MEFTCVPIIIIICYMVGEIYKVIFKRKEELFKLIPIIVTITGGILAVLIYLTNKEIIFNADNIWIALQIGLVSGASATTTNQIIKQVFKSKEVFWWLIKT